MYMDEYFVVIFSLICIYVERNMQRGGDTFFFIEELVYRSFVYTFLIRNMFRGRTS